MEQKSVLNCPDGRAFDLTMRWDDKIKDSEHVYPILFEAVDRATGRKLKMPREIATFAFGDPLENVGERCRLYYDGSREAMTAHYVEMAYRRVTDWIRRGR
jgi:hypothetical protein